MEKFEFPHVDAPWIEFHDTRIKKGWAYKTEVAEPITGERRLNVFDEEERNLTSAAKKINLSTGDISERNCGIVNGKLVIVDFGDVST